MAVVSMQVDESTGCKSRWSRINGGRGGSSQNTSLAQVACCPFSHLNGFCKHPWENAGHPFLNLRSAGLGFDPQFSCLFSAEPDKPERAK